MSGIYWLASYPKSGNTWFRTFLSNLQQNGDSPADINELDTGPIASSRGWLDNVLGFDTAELDPDEIDRLRPFVYRWSKQKAEIAYRKIHDAYTYTTDGLPLVGREATLGALYILRNPLDIALSAVSHWGVDVDECIKRMGTHDMAMCQTRKGLPTQTRQKLLTWSEHVLSWVDAPGLNCLTIRYEDMSNRPLQTFTEACRFLQLPADAERIEKAIRFSSFNILSGQEALHGFNERPIKKQRFFRQGKSGAWRDQLSAGQIQKIVADHHVVMRRFGYLDEQGNPL